MPSGLKSLRQLMEAEYQGPQLLYNASLPKMCFLFFFSCFSQLALDVLSWGLLREAE